MRVAGLFALWSASAILLSPRLALACAVCSTGREDETNTAFLISTIFLSLLPLGALGTLVFVLWRRIQKLEQTESESIRSQGHPALQGTAPISPAR